MSSPFRKAVRVAGVWSAVLLGCGPLASCGAGSAAVAPGVTVASTKTAAGTEMVAGPKTAEAAPQRVLRVAADPNNMPFSNDRGEGFENKIAQVLAREMGARVEYTWHAQRRGFFRQTLKEGPAEIVIGVPTGSERALTTAPYYRSAFVFVSRADRGLGISSLDDPRLKDLRIGVQIIGDDGNSPPPAIALGRRGLIDNLVGFTVYGDYREESPPSRIVRAVAAGDVDVAVVWGPLAGYYAAKQPVALELTPVTPGLDPPMLPMVFDISVGVRKGDTELRDAVDAALVRGRAEIGRVLDEYGVPRGDPGVQLPVMGNND